MSTPIGRTGLARVAGTASDAARSVTFPLDTVTSKVQGLDPTKSYDIFFSVAGPATVVIATTSDSAEAVAAGTAVYGADKAYATVSTDGYAGAIAAGATGVKVTHTKSGVAADSMPAVAALGGRFQARFAPKIASATVDAAAADQGTYGDYTALV